MEDKDNRQQKERAKTVRSVEQLLSPTITDEQRDYVRNVRRWLRESMQDKTRIVGGPI